ncbi:MAG: LysR substrate-binding domain-containing protein [Aquabacterium sp.]|nr:LysR substrate-binding domain-containing protein [Aquabacterium sp.]
MSNNADRLPPLDLLVAFEAVARHGSITLAAAERFITQSALSRQVQALETALGVLVFERRHRALVLTPAGERLLAATRAALAQLGEAIAAVRAPRPPAPLALTTTPSFAALWLIPRLAGFTGENPGVDVRIDASFERRDLRRDDFDIAVRYQPIVGGDGERLFGEALVPVCSPVLQRRKPHPLRTPADLVHHTLLQVADPGGASMPLEWEPWLRQLGQPQLQPAARLTFNSYNEAIAAALAGHGVTLGRRPLIDALLKKRQLAVPFGEATDTARAYFLLLSPAAANRPDAQALAAWLRGQAASV